MDITISINSKDVERLLAQAPQALDNALRGAITDSQSYFVALMKRYPPQRTGSTYRRTGTLGRSWSFTPVTRTSSGWQGRVGSNTAMAPYARFVQDRAAQRAIFRGRWRTAQDVAEQGASQVQRFADARIRAALGGL